VCSGRLESPVFRKNRLFRDLSDSLKFKFDYVTVSTSGSILVGSVGMLCRSSKRMVSHNFIQ
jgi:hypothetical protein